MAVIGSIRKRSGLLIIFVGVALAAFVLGDFIKQGPRKNVPLGVINGENISYQDFDEKVNDQVEYMKQQNNKENLSPRELFQARQQAWNIIVNELLMGDEYDELGISVSTEELMELVSGPNSHAYARDFFVDPQTQQFNPNLIPTFIENFDQYPEEVRKNWLIREKAIKDERLYMKYAALITQGYYVPAAFAKDNYETGNKKAEVKLVCSLYNSLSDSVVTVTEDDYEAYYEAHKHEFEQEESVDVDYIVFEVLPTMKDRQSTQDLVNNVFADFKKIPDEDVPYFVNRNSDPDLPYDSTFLKNGELPIQMDSVMFNSEPGVVVGPYEEGNAHHMARLLDVQFRPDSMRASHILIAYSGSQADRSNSIQLSKEDAEFLADSLLAALQANPLSFGEVSNAFNDDQVAKENGGDLDWFADGMMVGPFNEAVLKNEVGSIVIVETIFGYHIVQVTDKQPLQKKVRVALIRISIEPSQETNDQVYAEASQFASNNKTAVQFDKTAQENGLNIRNANFLMKNSNNIPGISNPRGIVQWAYMEDTEVGNVHVFDMDDKYVVACLKNARDEGIAELSDVRANIQPLVIREKKAAMMQEQMKAAASKGDIAAIASQLKLPLDTLDFVSYSSVNLPNYGPEPEVIGKLMTMQSGEISDPVKGRKGVFIVQLDKVEEPQPIEDYTMIRQQMTNMFRQQSGQMIYRALEESADIEDNRVMFF